MTAFESILYSESRPILNHEPPLFFHDLHLSEVVQDVIEGWEAYQLQSFFYTLLTNEIDIDYRQQVFKELERGEVWKAIQEFVVNMKAYRQLSSLAEKSEYPYQQQSFFLEASRIYLLTVEHFQKKISNLELFSTGMQQFRRYLEEYVSTSNWLELVEQTNELSNQLSAVRYTIFIRDLQVQVRDSNTDTDFSIDVERLFQKFVQEPAKDYRHHYKDNTEMHNVEYRILEGVATLYPALFTSLNAFYNSNRSLADTVILAFDREIHFYISWIEYTKHLTTVGLSFCYPKILVDSKKVNNINGFDLALASERIKNSLPVITNNFSLESDERIFIVSGPNQGGKTTFAKHFGQLHYLALLGLTVPGMNAELFLFDHLFTHFEREEDISTHRSKFEDDLLRIHQILSEATSDSIIILNEILSSTSLQDGLVLSRKIIETIDELDCICVWVTFMEDLTEYSRKTVSMVAGVKQNSPTERTYKVTRQQGNGMAYAISIAEKYNVTYEQLKKRLNHEAITIIPRP